MYIYLVNVFKENKRSEFSVEDTIPPDLLSKLFFENAVLFFFLFFCVTTVANNRMKC